MPGASFVVPIILWSLGYDLSIPDQRGEYHGKAGNSNFPPNQRAFAGIIAIREAQGDSFFLQRPHMEPIQKGRVFGVGGSLASPL